MMKQSIIEKYLDEIASNLYNNCAAVMIGAGFSKNAKKASTGVNKEFYDWNQLADKFYEKVYGRTIDEKVKYINPLSLAQEVETLFGRPVLDRMLKDFIPDIEYIPSDIHLKLLTLPWKDILTTNYDTLLERTCENISFKRFNIITCKEDLINSTDTTRIIKLHGSFPSHRKFIITEEDYRRYPQDYAPFVNTVQQSLIENTFCMIGFSCDDPNFLSWIGWIHDHLGKENVQKIYMISIAGESEVKQKKLLDKNIIVVNLADMWPELNYSERIDHFLSYIQEFIDKKYQSSQWISKSTFEKFSFLDISQPLESYIVNIEQLRNTYPDWIVLPWDKKNLVTPILQSLNSRLHELINQSNEKEINFIYEYVLFKDICTSPILIRDAFLIKDILNRNLKDENIELMNKDVYLTILLHLLRTYRENGMNNEWQIIYNELNEECLSNDNKQFLNYEECMFDLFHLKATELKNKILTWIVDESDIYWVLKKSYLLVEIGEHQKAKDIAMKSLNITRKTIAQDKSFQNYEWLISIESSLISLINHINAAIEETENLDFLLKKSNWKNSDFNFNWHHENEKYNLSMTSTYNPKNQELKYNFDLGIRTSVYSYGEDQALLAFTYLRFMEETGHPFRINHVTNVKGIEGVIKRILKYNSFWATITAIRSQNEKSIDDIFTRTILSELKKSDADEICRNYIEIISQILKEMSPNWFHPNNIFEFAAKLLPEIISRFCNKCSIEMLDNILQCSLSIYKSDLKDNFDEMNILIRRIMRSYKRKEQIARIEQLCEFPIDPTRPHKYPDPISFIHIIEPKIKLDRLSYNKIMNNLTQKIESEKNENFILRLLRLYFIIEMENEERQYIEKLLWQEYLDEGLPELIDFYSSALLNLPVPSNIKNLNSRLKSFAMKNFKEMIISSSLSDSTINYDEILQLIEENIINVNDLSEILILLTEMCDKIKAKDYRGFIVIENLRKGLEIISNIILNTNDINLINKYKENIEKYINYMQEYRIPHGILMIAYEIIIKQTKDIYYLLFPYILSHKKEDICDAMYVMWKLSDLKVDLKLNDLDYKKLIKLIIEKIIFTSINLDEIIIYYLILIVKKMDFENIVEFIDFLLYALKQAKDETIVNSFDNTELSIKKYEYRQSMAALAFNLYQLYNKKWNVDIPDILAEWKEICESEDEISEITTQWN